MGATNDDEPIELNISAEKIHDIILKAREFHLEEAPDEPDLETDQEADKDREPLLDEGEDPTEAELRELIDDLNEDEVIDLIAIVWTGRGDFGRTEFGRQGASARATRQALFGLSHGHTDARSVSRRGPICAGAFHRRVGGLAKQGLTGQLRPFGTAPTQVGPELRERPKAAIVRCTLNVPA